MEEEATAVRAPDSPTNAHDDSQDERKKSHQPSHLITVPIPALNCLCMNDSFYH